MFFFFNDTATTEIYTLSLHDALPILRERLDHGAITGRAAEVVDVVDVVDVLTDQHSRIDALFHEDRKSTRLNSSHLVISYAVFCLKKKKHNAVTPLYLVTSRRDVPVI